MLEPLLGLPAGQCRLDVRVVDPEVGPQLGIEGSPSHPITRLIGELLAKTELVGR